MQHYIVLAAVVSATAIAVYWFMVRPFLRARPPLQEVFTRIDDQESGLIRLFWHYFEGFRTLLWSRFLMISGLLLPVLDGIGTIDLADLVKAEWAKYVPLVLLLIGIVTEWLRKITNGPVMLPPADPIDPPAPPAA